MESQHSVDVLVIGGGITGLAAAYELARVGRVPVLLERDTIGSGSTGRSAGILTATTETDVSQLDAARKEYFTMGLNDLVRTIKKERIACRLRKTGGAYLALNSNGEEALKKEKDSVRGSRFAPRPKDLPGKPTAALFVDDVYHLDPLLLANGLRQFIESHGGKILERTTVTSIAGDTARTSAGTFRFRRAIDTRPRTGRGLTVTTDVAVIDVPPESVRSMQGRVLWTTGSFEYAYAVPVSPTQVLFGGTTRFGVHEQPDEPRLRSGVERFFPGARIRSIRCGTITLSPSTLPAFRIRQNVISVWAVCGLAAGFSAGTKAARSINARKLPRIRVWPYQFIDVPVIRLIARRYLHRDSPFANL